MSWLIHIEGITIDNTTGLKLMFLKLFTITVLHNNHKGGHLSIGLAFLIFECTLTLSTWHWKLFATRFTNG